MSRPVELDNMEHLEYVPTQVITEWFRHVFRTSEGEQIDGIVYPSARKSGGVCCALFVSNTECCDVSPGWEADTTMLLAMSSVETHAVQ